VHGSDSLESAAREIALFFDEKDIVEWERSVEGWIVER
jgi:nucleoside-diphosphate kinase